MYTEKELDRFKRFMDTTLAYKQEHLAVLSGDSEMTEEIFNECVLVCVKTNNPTEFYKICERYPEFVTKYPPDTI